MNWQVGDIALIVSPITGEIDGEGEIISIDDPMIEDGCDCSWNEFGNPSHLHMGLWSVKFAWLRPMPPANEATEWKNCIFQPKELVLVA